MLKVELNEDMWIILRNPIVQEKYPHLYREITSCPLPDEDWWKLSTAAYVEYEQFYIDKISGKLTCEQ